MRRIGLASGILLLPIRAGIKRLVNKVGDYMTGFQVFGAITLFSTIAIVAVCFILYVRIMRKRHFRCPYCHQRFKVSAAKSFTRSASGADRFLTCPYCGKSGYMEFMHDDEYSQTQEGGGGEPREESGTQQPPVQAPTAEDAPCDDNGSIE